MSKLSNLRDALVKLEAAEDALFHARESFRDQPNYSRLDHQYEMVGDAANIIRDILSIEEGERMKKIGAMQAQVAYYQNLPRTGREGRIAQFVNDWKKP